MLGCRGTKLFLWFVWTFIIICDKNLLPSHDNAMFPSFRCMRWITKQINIRIKILPKTKKIQEIEGK